MFSNHINDMISECIPNYHVTIKTRDKPGMTNKIKNLFKKANKLHKRALNTKHPRDIEKHASARRLAKCEFKNLSLTNNYYKLNLKLLEKETSSTAWWKLNKRELGQNQRASIPSLIVDNVVLNDNVEKCTALNRFFAEQCNLSVPFPSTQFLSNERAKIDNQTLPEIEEFSVSQYEAKEILKSVNANKYRLQR